jgi:hypothetical protein
MSALRTLLSGAIDYAGLFPPAELPMAQAVANFAAYRRSADAWALGRFVVPASRLAELEEVAAPHFPDRGDPWRLSVLASLPVDAPAIAAFNARHAGRALVDAVELRATTVDDVAKARGAPAGAAAYVEIPLTADPTPLLAAIKVAGARAKVRTGGTTADAFPSAGVVARFILGCAYLGVAFKATAGLHHPVRAEYALTYEPGSARGTMFGYLNVLVAAAFAAGGADEAVVTAVLEETEPAAFEPGDDLRWRGRTLPAAAVAEARRRLIDGFGSCSFREPLDELAELTAA